MKKLLSVLVCSLLFINSYAQLKAVVYDFDGLTIGDTDLPDDDFNGGDLSYKVVANPLAASDMIGDRSLELSMNWSSGSGTFGYKVLKFIEISPSADILNFYFYNPLSNAQNASVDVIISEDDDNDNFYDIGSDDRWIKTVDIPGNAGWQLIAIPVNTFTDGNAGGNGVFDATFTGNKGSIVQIEFKVNKAANATTNAKFYLDMIAFSEGPLPTGATILDLPGKQPTDNCVLGAFRSVPDGQQPSIPGQIEGLFPQQPGHRLKYVNWFMAYSMDGSAQAKDLPGNEVTELLNNGYTPVITWEPIFKPFDRLDPKQPRLSNIINGDYDAHIDAFGDKLKSYNDTIVIRPMHEFEGDWYSWSLVYNDGDPNKYIAAFRHIVDRVRARGATKVKWMWCWNGDYFPRKSYNWVVNSYPGDNYVDIVAADVYNNHTPTPTPSWKSFRSKAAETYYYATKYFPQKPFFLCELGCRERYDYENTGSETKAEWLAKMDKELQSNFHKIRALLFFSATVVFDWRVNSSPEVISAIGNNIWNDEYYFKGLDVRSSTNDLDKDNGISIKVFPSPAKEKFTLEINTLQNIGEAKIEIVNLAGQIVYANNKTYVTDHTAENINIRNVPAGIYLVNVTIGKELRSKKIILE